VKWRCPQCGKPHAKNDPPCDNCGHHKFERAVVPTASVDEDHEQFVWACSECGRHHQRNNPPCSRCGNAAFEKQPLEYDDFVPDNTPSYFELAGRLEVGAALVVVALVTVGVLGYLGVINVPGLTPQGSPTVENVPGNATAVDGISLDAVEDSYLATINDRRREAGYQPLERSGNFEDLATYYNQRRVKTDYGDGSLPSRDGLVSKFDISCNGVIFVPQPVSSELIDTSANASTIGELLATGQSIGGASTFDRSATRTGIDIHAGPDGTLYLTQFVC
jgi:ribosomal protein L37E